MRSSIILGFLVLACSEGDVSSARSALDGGHDDGAASSSGGNAATGGARATGGRRTSTGGRSTASGGSGGPPSSGGASTGGSDSGAGGTLSTGGTSNGGAAGRVCGAPCLGEPECFGSCPADHVCYRRCINLTCGYECRSTSTGGASGSGDGGP